MSLEQYKDANRKKLWEILQIQVELIGELEQFKKNALLRLKSSPELIDKQVGRIAELELMLIFRTKQVDDWILRYDKSVTKQKKIIAELEKALKEQGE